MSRLGKRERESLLLPVTHYGDGSFAGLAFAQKPGEVAAVVDRCSVYLHNHIPGVEARLLGEDGHLTLETNRIGEVHAWLAERI